MAGQVTVELNRAHLTTRLKKGKDLAAAAVAEAILADSRPFTPRDKGDLEDSGKTDKMGADYVVTWKTVYAAYQWYGCWPDGTHVIRHYSGDKHPRATGKWVEAAKIVYGDSWLAKAQDKFVEGAGG